MRSSRDKLFKCLLVALWLAAFFNLNARARLLALRAVLNVKAALFGPTLNGVFPAPWGAVLLLLGVAVLCVFVVAHWQRRRNDRRFRR